MRQHPRSKEIEPKFEDCRGCVHFNKLKEQPICRRCGVGEHFREMEQETELSEPELWKLFAGMSNYDD